MGICLVFAAIVLNFFALLLRYNFPRKCQIKSRDFLLPLCVGIAANVVALVAFWIMANVGPDDTGEYGLVLSVISLLSAGVIAGYFAHTHQDAEKDEAFVSQSISFAFSTLFYVLLGAVCFYSGLSTEISSAKHASIVVPVAAFLVLLAQSLYEAWDWRQKP